MLVLSKDFIFYTFIITLPRKGILPHYYRASQTMRPLHEYSLPRKPEMSQQNEERECVMLLKFQKFRHLI